MKTPLEILKALRDSLGKTFDSAIEEVQTGDEELTPEEIAAKEKADKEAADKKAADEADPVTALSERVAALETALTNLIEAMGKKTADEEAEAAAAAAAEEAKKKEEAADTADADTTARAEIIAPGTATGDMSATAIRETALKAANATTDGKAIIDALCPAGKKPEFKDSGLFVAASEVMKAQRVAQLAATKTGKTKDAETVDHHAAFAQKAAEMFKVPAL